MKNKNKFNKKLFFDLNNIINLLINNFNIIYLNILNKIKFGIYFSFSFV